MLSIVLPSDTWHKQMENVIQGPIIHEGSLQKQPPQCTSTWWRDRIEKGMEQVENYEEKWNCGLEGAEEEPVGNDQPHDLGPP